MKGSVLFSREKNYWNGLSLKINQKKQKKIPHQKTLTRRPARVHHLTLRIDTKRKKEVPENVIPLLHLIINLEGAHQKEEIPDTGMREIGIETGTAEHGSAMIVITREKGVNIPDILNIQGIETKEIESILGIDHVVIMMTKGGPTLQKGVERDLETDIGVNQKIDIEEEDHILAHVRGPVNIDLDHGLMNVGDTPDLDLVREGVVLDLLTRFIEEREYLKKLRRKMKERDDKRLKEESLRQKEKHRESEPKTKEISKEIVKAGTSKEVEKAAERSPTAIPRPRGPRMRPPMMMPRHPPPMMPYPMPYPPHPMFRPPPFRPYPPPFPNRFYPPQPY